MSSIHTKPIHRVHACLVVTCHLHFWQNERDLLRATAVYRNKNQHRKLTPEKKILPPLLPVLEPATFQSRIRRSNHWDVLSANIESPHKMRCPFCQHWEPHKMRCPFCQHWQPTQNEMSFLPTLRARTKWDVLSANIESPHKMRCPFCQHWEPAQNDMSFLPTLRARTKWTGSEVYATVHHYQTCIELLCITIRHV